MMIFVVKHSITGARYLTSAQNQSQSTVQRPLSVNDIATLSAANWGPPFLAQRFDTYSWVHIVLVGMAFFR